MIYIEGKRGVCTAAGMVGRPLQDGPHAGRDVPARMRDAALRVGRIAAQRLLRELRIGTVGGFPSSRPQAAGARQSSGEAAVVTRHVWLKRAAAAARLDGMERMDGR